MATTFKVLTQRPSSELTADGRFVDVMEITFEIPSGTVGTIQVPLAAYTPDTVRALLEDRAAAMIGVESL